MGGVGPAITCSRSASEWCSFDVANLAMYDTGRMGTESSRAALEFLLTDLDLAMTFLDVVDTSTIPETVQRNRHNARRAYDAVCSSLRLRFLFSITASLCTCMRRAGEELYPGRLLRSAYGCPRRSGSACTFSWFLLTAGSMDRWAR